MLGTDIMMVQATSFVNCEFNHFLGAWGKSDFSKDNAVSAANNKLNISLYIRLIQGRRLLNINGCQFVTLATVLPAEISDPFGSFGRINQHIVYQHLNISYPHHLRFCYHSLPSSNHVHNPTPKMI